MSDWPRRPPYHIRAYRRHYGVSSDPRRRRWLWLFLLALGLLGALGLGWLYLAPAQPGERSQPSWQRLSTRLSQLVVPPSVFFGGRDRVNILLIGVDVNRDRHGRPLDTPARSDTILIASFDRWGQRAYLLSIPRDTAVQIPGHGFQKVNAAHALGGPELLMDTLEQNFGILVHHWVRTRFEGFIKLVDLVGGVELEVEKDMDYDDNWGNLHIHLKKGWQLLDGDKAHQYVRFRHDPEGDLGRVRRQQKLLRALARKALSPAVLLRLPSIVRTLRQYVDTDLSTHQILSLATFARSIDLDTVETATLPVTDGPGTLLLPLESGREVLERFLGPTFYAYTWENRPRLARLPRPRRPSRPMEEPSLEEVTSEASEGPPPPQPVSPSEPSLEGWQEPSPPPAPELPPLPEPSASEPPPPQESNAET